MWRQECETNKTNPEVVCVTVLSQPRDISPREDRALFLTLPKFPLLSKAKERRDLITAL